MGSIAQTMAVTALSLRTLPLRLATSAVVVIGIAVVVAVLISVLAMATGFSSAAQRSGRADRAIVLSQGAFAESGSQLQRAATANIMDAPGVRRGAQGRPVASAEALAYFPLTERRTGRDTMMTLRGVGTEAFALRPEIRIVAGRAFTPALREVIIGRSALTRLDGISVDSEIVLPEGGWKVVGVFESAGDSHESELLTDVDTLMTAFGRGDALNGVTVALDGEAAFQQFADALTADPTLSVSVRRESDYFADTSRPISRLLAFIAYFIGGVMALGAVFAALNTMYSTVSARTVEIATLRAIGFGAAAVIVSVLIEALLLSALGAMLGTWLAYVFFEGNVVSTLSGTSPSKVTYALSVTPELVLLGAACAGAIGLIGGLLPAIAAARLPVATAIRARA